MPTVVPKTGSFLEKLEQVVYLNYVLRFAGVAGFAWAFLSAWNKIPLVPKAGMLAAVAAWFVGERFNKIYR